jgi:glucose/arabinose dehydrogenase
MSRRSARAITIALAAFTTLNVACESDPDSDSSGPGPETELAEGSATLPSQFAETTIASGLSSPTAMAIAPDGRIFVAQQGGALRVVKNGSLLSTPFRTFTVNSSGERGLLGVAFDPNFASNRFVYVYYTATSPSIHNRVSRLTASSTNPDVAASGETILLELNNLSSATNHNGGAIHFGPDGKLYIAVGENANGNNAQSLGNMLGKMLRINSDGSIPTDNPFYTMTSGNNRSIWARGLRNPYTFAFQPGTGRMFINDVGQNTWEEIDEGAKGANYGWPTSEGNNNTSGFKAPFHTYATKVNGTCAIIGGAFYNPTTANFPSSYVGQYFFGDYCAGWIRRIDPSSKAVTGFLTGLGSNNLVDIKVANDGSLYYLGRSGGRLMRVRYTGSSAPTISQHPASQTVSVGGSATFSVTASGSSPLSYQWQRNGANISGATSASYTRTNIQSTDNGSTYRCVVSNSAGSATSNAATLTVTTNTAPMATINTPTAGTLYTAGQTINYSGSATDAQGALNGSAFTWRVDLHHDTHTHPHVAPTTGSTSGSFVIPTRGETSHNVWYRIHLTVTDSGGLSHSVFRDVMPRKANVTLASNPTGLQLTVDGQPVTTPFTFTGVVGIIREIAAISPQSSNGKTWQFGSWSDGGGATHEISTPATATTYTATFMESAGAGPLPTGWMTQDVGSVGMAGSATHASGTFTVAGSGADVWGTADGFRYAFRTLSGDGEITARVNSVTNTNAWAKAGVMIREALTAGSKHGFMLLAASGTVAFQRRATTGGTSASTGAGTVAPPTWVRLRRTGTTIAAFHSSNGTTWTPVGSETISMTTNVFVGLAVTSHDNTKVATATFDNVAITTGGGGDPGPGEDTKFAIAGSAVTSSSDDGNVAANTVDGNLGTRWSASGDGQWIQFDLGQNRRVSLVKIAFYNGDLRTATFDILTSTTGTNFTAARTGVVSAQNTSLQTFDFTDVDPARYVRIVGHGNSINLWNSFTEVEIWGGASGGGGNPPAAAPTFSPGGGTYTSAQTVTITTATAGASIRYTTDGSTPTPSVGTVYSAPVTIGTTTTLKAVAYGSGLTTSAVTTAMYTISSGTSNSKLTSASTPVTASTFQDGNPPQAAVDGNMTSRWAANGDGQWIRLDLGASRRVAFVKLAVYSGATRIARFDVQTSSDGTTWNNALVSAQSAMNANLQTFEFNDVPSARYVRIVGHGNTQNTWNSFFEIEVWGGN